MTSFKKITLFLATVCLLAAGVSQAESSAAGADKVLATVNGTPIKQSLVDFLVKLQTSRGQQDTPQLRKVILENLITREVLVQEAKRKNLDKSDEVKMQDELASQDILVAAYQNDFTKSNPITDDMIKAEYDRAKAQVAGKTEYKVRHILLDSEADVKKAYAKLKKGDKFEKVAKEMSKDEGSKNNGGDLGWNAPGHFVKEFDDAMAKLKKGETTKDAIKSQYGYHIVHLDDTRSAALPPLDEVKDQIRKSLLQDRFKQAITDLRNKAKITETDSTASVQGQKK